MTISLLTLFPEIFKPIFSTSITGRAVKNKLVKINLINIRDFAQDKHKTVDDKPYGGGVGMILRVDIVERAIAGARNKELRAKKKEKVVLLDPTGKLYNQKMANKYSKLDHLIFVCGHYEGIDERIKYFVDEVVSVGEYVLTGGEVPAMAIADSVIRLLPKVLSKEAVSYESFSQQGIVEPPQFTRPTVYKGYQVPNVLLSGNHKEIERWKKEESAKRSRKRKSLLK